MAKKQHYMTYPERIRLETMLKFKVSVTVIARELGFARQTIYNEIKRGQYECINSSHGLYKTEIRYSADKGQQLHDKANRNRGRPLKIGNDIAYADFLEKKMLLEKCSPAAALVFARSEGFTTSICVGTVYNYIDQGVFYAMTNADLLEKTHRKKKKEKNEPRIAHPGYPSIENRPAQINQRTEPGHWEIDLIIGKQETTAALLVMTERITREVILRKIPNKKSATIVRELDRLEKAMPDFRERIKTITTDNGSEFLDYEGMRRSIYGDNRCEIYYCHSYSSWEKGTIERNNRMIRRFFPKGTDFTRVTKKQVAAAQKWMNNYPRKILNWKTPAELTA